MRIVLDTNVLVSGLLDEASIPARIVDLWLAGDIDLVVDERIVAEYRDVLHRPELGLNPAAVNELLAVVTYAEQIVAPPLPISLPDPDDLAFLEVAVAGAVDALVTGNAKHFRIREGRLAIPILTPREFLRRLARHRAIIPHGRASSRERSRDPVRRRTPAEARA